MVVLCGGALFAVFFYRSRPLTPAALMKRLPAKDSLVVAIDFAALRSAGVLQMLDGSKMGQEADYAKFVAETDFNYTQDLDYALAAFGPNGKYILAKGRFDWKALRAYAIKQGGECYNALCRMAGSAPERKISFVPVQQGLMALAVTPVDDAAMLMAGAVADRVALPTPDAAVWLYLPQAILKSNDLPEGTVQFARSVDEAKSVTLGFAPDGNRIAARLNVLCKSDQDAAIATAELMKVTEVLRKMIAQAGQHANPADWSGVLTAGKFENKGSRVFGYWPIERVFVEKMLAGQ
jgi:hypothetical protein